MTLRLFSRSWAVVLGKHVQALRDERMQSSVRREDSVAHLRFAREWRSTAALP